MAYERVNWENLPSTNTPVNADNLNKMDAVINSKQDKLIAGTGIEITGKNIINNIQGNYSTEEVKIGTWIDGKPLYRKVIKVAVSSTTQSISLNFSIDKLKSLNGGLENGNQIIPFGYKDDSNYCSAFIQKNNNSLYCMSSWRSGTFYIILEYTKTTD